MAVTVTQIPVGKLGTNCYILADPASKKAIVIDPGAEPEKIWSVLQDEQLQVQMIVNTHGHWDHIGGNAFLAAKTGAPLAIYHTEEQKMRREKNLTMLAHLKGDGGRVSILLKDGDALTLGDNEIKVLHTPGHTAGGISLLCGKLLFSGDTLFQGSIGRSDLEDGSYEEIIDSIRRQLMPLADDVVVYPGHGPQTTIGFERAYNPYIRQAAPK